MKKMTENFKHFLFVTVLLFTTSNIFASNSKPSLEILNSERKVVTLNADNVESTSLTIRIFDEQGINLLQEDVAINSRLSKAYDFSKLPQGTYEVEIENYISIREYTVSINSNNLTIVENEEKEIHKPVVKTEGKSILFNMLNLNLNEVTLVIINGAGEEIYEEKIEGKSAIHKSYDLAILPAGIYSVSVKTATKNFNNEINLK